MLPEGRVGEEFALLLLPPPPPLPTPGVGEETPHEAPATLNGGPRCECACEVYPLRDGSVWVGLARRFSRGPLSGKTLRELLPLPAALEDGLRRAPTWPYPVGAWTVAMLEEGGAWRFGLGVREWLGLLRFVRGVLRLGCFDRSSAASPPPAAFRQERP